MRILPPEELPLVALDNDRVLQCAPPLAFLPPLLPPELAGRTLHSGRPSMYMYMYIHVCVLQGLRCLPTLGMR